MKSLIIHTDGGARGNPGPAGIGVVIQDERGKVLEEHAVYLGRTTNNQAEYRAVILGLQRARDLGAEKVTMITDSELLVRQMNGIYRVKNPDLLKRWHEAKYIDKTIHGGVVYKHVKREFNKHADALSNKAMDQGLKEQLTSNK